VLVRAVNSEVIRLAALDAVIALPLYSSVVVEAHEPFGDQSKHLVIQIIHLLLYNRQQSRYRNVKKNTW
jgi:hypothetical protein